MSSGGSRTSGAYVTIDIGGTNCRSWIGDEKGTLLRAGSYEEEHGGQPTKLDQYAQAVIGEALKLGPLEGVVVSAAGQVEKDVAEFTNWPGNPCLTVKADPQGPVVQTSKGVWTWGIPAGRVRLVNDLVAAVHGLVGVLGADWRIPDCCPRYSAPSYKTAEDDTLADERLVLIMPGTGLGTAALVRTHDAKGDAIFTAVPSEMQHAQIPAFDAAQASLIERWKADTAAPWLRWEDFVSGKGLETAYRLLGGKEDLDAEGIAQAAQAGYDRPCVESLALFYRCVARYAQLAALAYQPTAGVFIGGDTTRLNAGFIEQRLGNLLWHIQDNPSPPHHRALLNAPIRLVVDERIDLNLHGGLWLAVH